MELTYKHTYFLTAGECNAESRMPVTLLTARIIEVATEHANALNVGWARLKPMGIGWVLSGLTVEMDRWPGINETYTLTTWVEDFNRLYSDRCFEVADGEGRVIGHVRSLWVAIDLEKRTAADLSVLEPGQFVSNTGRCPLPRRQKLPAVTLEQATLVEDYTYRYCDIDFNGHVNTVRHIEHVLNLWGPEMYAATPVRTMQIQFLHECRYGERVSLQAVETPGDGQTAAQALVSAVADGERRVAAKIVFARGGEGK